VGIYLELIRTVFEAVDDEEKLRNRIVAFTSACPKEGVSYVVNAIAKELATHTGKRVLAVDAVGLPQVCMAEPGQVAQYCSETQIDNLLTFPTDESSARVVGLRGPEGLSDWHSDREYRIACLKALRWNFDYVVVDCPSLAVSADAARLASIVDGIGIVVEAGRTRAGQIHRARQVIEAANGTFVGFVLNQRRYTVPNWLYKRL
jgi:hypothetical protein